MGAQIDSSRPGSPADAVRRWQRGDDNATEELARAASRLALRTAAALLGSREEAGEVAQDVAVDVLGSLGKLREPAAFNAWVHRITVRHALRRLKKRRGAGAAETPLRSSPAPKSHLRPKESTATRSSPPGPPSRPLSASCRPNRGWRWRSVTSTTFPMPRSPRRSAAAPARCTRCSHAGARRCVGTNNSPSWRSPSKEAEDVVASN